MGGLIERLRGPGQWAAVIAIAIAGSARPAAAQRMLFQADGALNVGYNQQTRPVFVADPNSDEADVPPSSVGSMFTEISPGIALHTGSPRLSWRFGYRFSANLRFAETTSSPSMTGGQSMDSDQDDDPQSIGYTNSADAALAAQLTPFTTMTLTATIAQGGTSFLLSQRPAETGSPEIRAPGNPSMITTSLAETLSWEVGRQWTLQQSLRGNFNAQQDNFDNRNSAVNATLGLERLWVRDTAGIELRSGVSWLRPLNRGATPYQAFDNALLARWNHDFTWRWNASFSAGVEQVYTDTGSKPLAFLPSGAVNVNYTIGNTLASLGASRGTQTNLQVGSISIADELTARGVITLDADQARSLSFSGGILHNEPLGDVSEIASAGTGNALQADVGFGTAITKSLAGTARYSLAYQFDQPGALGATLTHVFLVGVTATYNNVPPDRRRMPGRGLRVDQGDAEGFPVVETP